MHWQEASLYGTILASAFATIKTMLILSDTAAKGATCLCKQEDAMWYHIVNRNNCYRTVGFVNQDVNIHL